jgi:hypothetical protein
MFYVYFQVNKIALIKFHKLLNTYHYTELQDITANCGDILLLLNSHSSPVGTVDSTQLNFANIRSLVA